MKDFFNKFKVYLALHVVIAMYSFGGIFSKMAGKEQFLSFKFCLCYVGLIGILFFYAIVWQQIIKRLPLTAAFANKAVTVVWGMVWGFIIFKEHITMGKVVGGLFVIAGVIIYSLADKKDEGNSLENIDR